MGSLLDGRPGLQTAIGFTAVGNKMDVDDAAGVVERCSSLESQLPAEFCVGTAGAFGFASPGLGDIAGILCFDGCKTPAHVAIGLLGNDDKASASDLQVCNSHTHLTIAQ